MKSEEAEYSKDSKTMLEMDHHHFNKKQSRTTGSELDRLRDQVNLLSLER